MIQCPFRQNAAARDARTRASIEPIYTITSFPYAQLSHLFGLLTILFRLHLFPFLLRQRSIVFAIHTYNAWLLGRDLVIEDHRCQLSASDAAAVKAFGVLVQLQAAIRVVAVDNGRTLV